MVYSLNKLKNEKFDFTIMTSDLFLPIWSILPMLYVTIFFQSFMNEKLDTVFLIYQTVFLLWYGILTLSIPQLNNWFSRVMVIYITYVNLYLATSLLIGFRPRFLGSEVDIELSKWIMKGIIHFGFLSLAMITEKSFKILQK
jgi:hypothetical protein